MILSWGRPWNGFCHHRWLLVTWKREDSWILSAIACLRQLTSLSRFARYRSTKGWLLISEPNTSAVPDHLVNSLSKLT